MNARKTLMALVIVAGLLLVGCVPLPDAAGNPLVGTSWMLASLNGQSVPVGASVTLRFAKDEISGTDGCNRYRIPYTVSDAKISITNNGVTTLMACTEPVMQQAAAYFVALTAAATYKIEGQQLTLSDASGKPLASFTRQSTELGGTSWVATGYNNGKQAVVSVVAGSQLTADFSADGRLSGLAGCNNYTATYEASGMNIKISAPASTRMACAEPAGVMEQEAQFLQALATAATYDREGDQLELRTADGALAVTFSKVPPEN